MRYHSPMPSRESLIIARDTASRAYFDAAYPPGRIAPITPEIIVLRQSLRDAEATLAAWTPPPSLLRRIRQYFRGQA